MLSGTQDFENEQADYTILQNFSFSQPTEFNGMNANIPNNTLMYHEAATDDNPYLKIIEQPCETFRYRYLTDKASHGKIKGQNAASSEKPTYPMVKLENCPQILRDKIIIRASLYTDELEPKPHVYDLLKHSKKKKDNNCLDKKCEERLDKDFNATFSSLEILAKTKPEVLQILKERKIFDYGANGIPYDNASVEKEAKEELNKINLNSSVLCFEALVVEDTTEMPLCGKVFSNPVRNEKSAATGNLRICHLSHYTGKCSGGEKIVLLCDKIQKDDIEVHFYGEDPKWESKGVFTPAEVHHQYAIIVTTPKYSLPIKEPQEVFIQLRRRSNQGKPSEPRSFTYLPDDGGICHRCSKELAPVPEINLNAYLLSENSSKRKRPNPEINTPDSEISGAENTSHFIWEDTDLEDILKMGQTDSITNNAQNFVRWSDIFSDVNKNVNEKKQSNSFACSSNSSLKTDSVDEISDSVDHMSITDKNEQELGKAKKQAAAKDFVDGMQAMLQTRYAYYAPHLIRLKDENGNSMLHLAISEQYRNWNLIRLMLEMVSEDLINCQNMFKQTPLHLAIKGNHRDIFLLLLIKGGNPNLCDIDGNNCLHLAAKYGHAQLLNVMLDLKNRGAWKHTINDIDILNNDGMSALHVAITKNFEDCVTLLLKFKANVNLPEKKSGSTALHLAFKHPSIMQIILKQPETDVHVKDFRGYTVVDIVCLETGNSFEVISAQLKDDKEKILEFLKNIKQIEGTTTPVVQNSEKKYEDDLTDQDSEAESEGSSSDDSETEDLDEKLNLNSCNEVEIKASSMSELSSTNEKKFSLMETEERLCKYLDVNDNWKKLANMIGLNVSHVETFDKELSPGRTVLKSFKKLYPLGYLKPITELLNISGLEEGVQIVQGSS